MRLENERGPKKRCEESCRSVDELTTEHLLIRSPRSVKALPPNRPSCCRLEASSAGKLSSEYSGNCCPSKTIPPIARPTRPLLTEMVYYSDPPPFERSRPIVPGPTSKNERKEDIWLDQQHYNNTRKYRGRRPGVRDDAVESRGEGRGNSNQIPQLRLPLSRGLKTKTQTKARTGRRSRLPTGEVRTDVRAKNTVNGDLSGER